MSVSKGINVRWTKKKVEELLTKYDTGATLLSEKVNTQKESLRFRCACGEVFDKRTTDILRNKTCRCKKCRYKATRAHFQFDYDKVKRYIEIESNSGCRLLSTEYINNSEPLKIQCKCGNVFEKPFAKLKDRKETHCINCKLCKRKPSRTPYTTEEVRSKVKELSGDEYALVGEYTHSGKKITLECNNCGNLWIVLFHSFQSGARCRCNSRSRGERKIEKILKDSNIAFEEEKTFPDLRSDKNFPLRFDFYLPEKRTAIEYDGEFHFKEMDLRHVDLSYQIKNDEIKNKFCKEKDIKLLRIPYWRFDDIEQILRGEL